ncbi:hypothetical protein [Cryobacterium lactosi]|uniref:hypothetical protein n=1 Tax=Cryobacterium lactosi TaxID=1259202 RepID=UPI00141B950C|nr:hypothetical protein [Cryobacterium lactosi]
MRINDSILRFRMRSSTTISHRPQVTKVRNTFPKNPILFFRCNTAWNPATLLTVQPSSANRPTS